jgi:hypothetical protein
VGCHFLSLSFHYSSALFNGQLQEGLTLDERALQRVRPRLSADTWVENRWFSYLLKNRDA